MADWREVLKNYLNKRSTQELIDEYGPAAFTTLEAARIGNPEALEGVARITGSKNPSQAELAAAQRYFEGRMQRGTWGPLAATALNLGYEGAKGLSQVLGIPEGTGYGQGILGLGGLGGDFQTGPGTSPASLENVVRTQAGIMFPKLYK